MINKLTKIIKDHFKKFLILGWIVLFVSLLMSNNLRNFALEFCRTYPVYAPIILIITQLFFGLLILPCSPLSAIAGVLWGFELGLVYSIIASLISSTFTFIVGKFFKKKYIIRNIKSEIFKKINALIDKYTWVASAIVHANPVFPGSSVGYVFAFSKIDLKKYVLGAFIGMIPLQIFVVGFGSLSRNWAFDKNIFLLLIIFFLGLIVMIYISIMPKLLKISSLNKFFDIIRKFVK